MLRPTALIVALLLLATALWLWTRDDVAAPQPGPTAGAPEDPDGGARPAVGAAAGTAPQDAVATEREDASPELDAPSHVVRGVVLADPAMPDLRGMRAFAYEGEAHDVGGLLPGAMAGMQRRSRGPAFVLDGDPIAEVEVDAAGRFELRTNARHLRVTLDHDFYVLALPEIVHFGPDEATREVVLSPLLGGKVRGRLLGAQKADADEVQLTLEPDPLSVLRDSRAMMAALLAATKPAARPRDDATFVFRGVTAGARMTLTARGGRATGSIHEPPLQPGEVRDVVLPVTAAALLEVTVVDEQGEPIEGARVQAMSAEQRAMTALIQARRGRTDGDGRHVFDSCEPSTYSLEAMATGFTVARAEVDVRAGSEPTRATLTLREGGVVTGVVRDPDGNPLAGAHVAHHPSADIPLLGDLAEQLGPEYMQQVASEGAETDEQGRFRLTGLADDGEFLVVGAHERFGAGIVSGVQMGDEDVVVTLAPLARIVGSVVAEETGAPVTEYTLSLQRTAFLVVKMPVARELVTDAAGAFELAGVGIDSYSLQVEAHGFATLEKSVRVPDDGVLDVGALSLQKAASVRGVVRDEAGRPIANALVRKRRGAMADNPMLAMLAGGGERAYSDAEGRFVLEPMAAGRLQLIATAQGFATGRSERLELEAGQQLDDVVVELGHGGSIHGRLVCGAGQRPEDFMLLVQHQITQNSTSAEFAPDGSFVVDNLDAGAYQVQAMPADLMTRLGGMGAGGDWRPGEGMDLGELMRTMTDNVVSQRCSVRAGDIAEVTLDVGDLSVGARWTLKVEVGGAPAPAGVVEATSLDDGTLRVAMLGDGVATFGRMRPGSHRVQVRTGLSMTPVGTAEVLDYPKGVESHTSTLSLPGGALRGRVVDAETGEPLHNAIVRLHHDEHAERDDPIGIALCDRDGAFAFRGLADGVYSLVAAEPISSAGGRNVASRKSGVRVEAGRDAEPVELRSRPAAGANVLVTAPDGRPLAGATVLCVDAEGRPLGGLGIASTGADGRAWFGGMADGPARVVGRARGFAPGATDVQTLTADQPTRFTLALAGGAPTRVTVVDGAGRRLRGATLTARFEDGPWLPTILLVQGVQADGSFELGPLGPGRWTFRATHPSFGTRTRERTITGKAPVTVVVEGS